MPKKLLIDADVFVDFLLGEQHAREFLANLPEATFYYSPLTRLELLANDLCADPGVRNATAAVLSLGKKVDIDDSIVSLASEIKRKHAIGMNEAILAASALHIKAELVTKNIGAYRKITELLLMRPY